MVQVPTLSITATLAVINATAPSPPPVCPTATCYYAAPVWVPSNNSNSTTDTVYVASFPRHVLQTGSGIACSESINSTLGTAAGSFDPALTLDGLSVRVVSIIVPKLALDGTNLNFWGADPFNVSATPWNASAADVEAAIKWATPGYSPSVTRQR